MCNNLKTFSIQSNSVFDDEVILFINRSIYGVLFYQGFKDKSVAIKLYDGNRLIGLIVYRFVFIKYSIKIAVLDMCAISEGANENEDIEIRTLIYDRLIKEVKEKNIAYIYFSRWSREYDNKLIPKCFILKKHATFLLNINKNENELFDKFNSKLRNTIRKGLSSNLKIICYGREIQDNVLNDFADLMLMTQMKAVKKNKKTSMLTKSSSYLKSILFNEASFIIVAYRENTIIAGALIIYSGSTMYYYLGASNLELNRKYAAADLLQWEIIKYGTEKGIKFYDLGGVPINPGKDHPAYGVYKFKEKFEGEYREYYGGYYSKNIGYYLMFKLVFNNLYLKRYLHKILLKLKVIEI